VAEVENIEVLFGSDGSTDSTNVILTQAAEKYSWLKPYIFPERRGKATVLNELAKEAKGDVFVLGDADHFYSPDAIAAISTCFTNPRVGGAGGTVIMNNADGASGVDEAAYYAYDVPIKTDEGDCGCMIGAHGGLMAIRADVWEDIPVAAGFTDDFFISMLPLEKGYAVVSCRDAISTTESAASIESEFRRKVRFSSTSFATLARFKPLLFKKPLLVAYCFWSHRVIKWFLWFFLIIAFISNKILAQAHIFFLICFIIQCSIYVTALLGLVMKPFVKLPSILSIPTYFVISNAALLTGFVRYLRGKQSTQWKPQRTQ
ncbi:MAG: glycosyltransferase, partial [Candidatus Kapabacteria bacterium]|nr:glycosyltransferase [Candidatus Kapabacteria bacterium]